MKILFYCGINNLINFNRIRPYYDMCYGFDANPDKIEWARKIYSNDPGVEMIYGALTDKDGEEIEFTITTDWDPASSLGNPNPEYIPIKNNPHILSAQKKIKVPTINLYDFCVRNHISEIDTFLTDLQGIDFTVLKTLTKFIQTGKIREIQCEVEPDDKPARYLGIPSGKLKDFNDLLSENYDVVWMDPPGPPKDAWEMDVRWRVKGSNPIGHVEFVVENELLVPIVKSYFINFVYMYMSQTDIRVAHRGNILIIWSTLPVKGCDAYVYTNAFSYKGDMGGVDFLLMLEPAVVLPGEYDQRVWKHFDHVLGVFDALETQVDKYHKVLYPRADIFGKNPVTEIQDQRESLYPLSNRKNAICMINGNKKSHVPYELYSKRIEIARWFAEYSRMPFDVFGKPPFQLPNYRGIIPDGQKLAFEKLYRYNLCFENTNDPDLSAGYVTEKILDCLETRTIPIYLGAANIEKYIPEGCFIDFRKFADYQELDDYLHSISQAQYKNYIDNIDAFVCGGGLRKFSESALCDDILEILAEEKLVDVKYAGNYLNWRTGMAPSVRQMEWETSDEPVMWMAKHLSRAEPPVVKNGNIRDRRQNKSIERAPKSFLIGKKPSIRILAAGARYFSGNARQGYDYGWRNLFDALNRFENIEMQFFDYATEAQQRGIAGMSEHLEDLVNKEKPDLLFYSPSGLPVDILPESLEYITDHTDTQTVIWFNHPEGLVNEGADLRLPCGNYLISTSPETVHQYLAAGCKQNVIISQWGFNPFAYAVAKSPGMWDLSFCGTKKGNRPEILEKMKQKGLPVNVFGSGWHKDSFIPFCDMVSIFSQSRINLNLSDASDFKTGQIRRRTFEVPGCHGFLITTPCNHLDEYYEPGKELVLASSLEELIDKAKYYLVHERERETIAQCGYERTLAEHTWTHRLVDIFNHIGFKAVPQPFPQVAPNPLRASGKSIPIEHISSADREQRSVEAAGDEPFLATVWVLAYNQLEYTKKCVESILHYTKGPYELLLVDHGSTDETYEYFSWVKSFHPHTRVIRYFQNRIIEETCNHIFAVARGKYLAVATNDTVVHEGWLENFIRHIESAPDIAVVGPRSNNISGPQAMPADYKTLEAYHTFAAEWSEEHREENFPIERMVGMCTLTKKDVYERIGGGDPDLPTNGRDGGYGFSDDDYSLRLRLGGYRSLVANDVFIHHYGSVTVRQHRPDLFGAPQNINKEKFLKKIGNNPRIVQGADGDLILKPYMLDDLIPIEERTVIRTPRICFVETGDDLSMIPGIESRYAAVAQKYNGQIVQNGGETISSLILKALEEKEYDFLVLIDSRLAPSPEILSALTEYALYYPDVAVMVPIGNYAPATHAQRSESTQEVEIIPFADLSLCVLNLKIIRPLHSGLARCENDDELLWFLQRRVRGESYFVAKANGLEVNVSVPVLKHPYDVSPLSEQLVQENKYAEAAAIYCDDLRKDPNFAEAYYQLAAIAKEREQKSVAVEHARQALEADPHHILSLVLLSRIFIEQDDFNNAMTVVSQANFKQPGHPEVQKVVSMYEEKFKEQLDTIQKDTNKKFTFLAHREHVKGKVSIVMVTNDRLDYTKKCVNSIRKYTRRPHEIIFVDNASTDGTVKWLKRQVKENKNYCLIENKENIGLTKGRNQGIHATQGEYIVLLDNDVIVSRGWLDSMLQCLNSGTDVGIVGPMTNSGSGIQQVLDESYKAVDYLDKYAAKFMEQYRHRRLPCRNIAGFCLLFKRTLIERIGLLDETIESGHFEDEDFCLRARLEDYSICIAGDVFIHNFGGEKSFAERKTIDKKWSIRMVTPEGRRLAVLKAIDLANKMCSQGKIDQAVETFINCIKLMPNAEVIYYEFSRIFIESKRFSEAWEVIGTMPEAAKDDLKGLEYSGYAKEGLGMDDEADAYAELMLSQNENYPAALNLKGVLDYKKGDNGKAAVYFRKAIEADPGYGEAYANLGFLYWSMGEKDKGLSNMRRGFILSPSIPDINSLYYSTLASLGLFKDAEVDFREACLLNPDNKNLIFLYIDILIQLGEFEAAMLKIEDAQAEFGFDDLTLKAALMIRDQIGPLEIEQGTKKRTLSLCMIVKNEEKNLPRCLKSVREVVDEIIITDTGSTDRTMDIARIFGAKVFEFPWTGDFSAARNDSLQRAMGDWILVLDADEVMATRDFEELKQLIGKSSSPIAYFITTRNYTDVVSLIGLKTNTGQYPEEQGAGWFPSTKVRLFPRRKEIYFSHPVHELVEYSLINANIPMAHCNILVHHYGKLDKERESLKGEEYYLMGKMKYENDPTNPQYISELAKQAQILGKYEEAITLWNELLSLVPNDPKSPDYRKTYFVSYGDPIAEIHIQLAAAYLQLDRYDEALQSARKAMKTENILDAYIHVYAYCEIIAGSREKATSAVEKLFEKDPDYLPAIFLKTIIFCLEGRKEKLPEMFLLLTMKGDYSHVRFLLNALAKRLIDRGKKDEAMLILNAAVENKFSDKETIVLLETIDGVTPLVCSEALPRDSN